MRYGGVIKLTKDETTEINNQIRQCSWRQDVCGVGICQANILPCQAVLDNKEYALIRCIVLGKWYKKQTDKNSGIAKEKI